MAKAKARPRAAEFRIRGSNRTYFKCMTPIGPAFGATWETAQVFADGWDAYDTLRRFPMIVMADLVNGDGEKCTVTGEPMDPVPPRRRAKRKARR